MGVSKRLSSICLILLSGCSTVPSQEYATSFEQFEAASVGTAPLLIRSDGLLTEGSAAEQALLQMIESLGPEDSVEIRQFYVRKGESLKAIHRALAQKVAIGTRVRMRLDFMFSVSALKEFDDLKVYPNFQLEIIRPPSAAFISYVAGKYDIRDASTLIDAVISANVEKVDRSLQGSKLAGAVDSLKGKSVTPEQVLGLVLRRVVAETSWFGMLSLKSQLLSLANRYHDKILIIHRAKASRDEYLIGGRGWADSFFNSAIAGTSLSYRDLDFRFSTGAGSQLPARLYISPQDVDRAAREFQLNTIALIDAARDSIEIFTPYFVPTQPVIHALHRAESRGVSISVFTNSIESSDIPLVPIFTLENISDWASAIGPHFQFATFQGANLECFHGKVAIVDHELIMIGNGNWDARSFLFDTDSFVAFRSRSLGHELESRLLLNQAPSWRHWTREEIESVEKTVQAVVPEKVLKEAQGFLKESVVQDQL